MNRANMSLLQLINWLSRGRRWLVRPPKQESLIHSLIQKPQILDRQHGRDEWNRNILRAGGKHSRRPPNIPNVPGWPLKSSSPATARARTASHQIGLRFCFWRGRKRDSEMDRRTALESKQNFGEFLDLQGTREEGPSDHFIDHAAILPIYVVIQEIAFFTGAAGTHHKSPENPAKSRRKPGYALGNAADWFWTAWRRSRIQWILDISSAR